MEFDETIARLGARLDAWFDSNQAIFESEDTAAQAQALRAGFEILAELDQIKSDGLAALSAILDPQNGIALDEHVASPVRAFEFAATLKATLRDELSDTDGANELVLKINMIANRLDESRPGRTVLAVLLDHAKESVRASAGAYLVDLMPDRVVPILREIDQKDSGTSADFTAHWALVDWELKQKAGKRLRNPTIRCAARRADQRNVIRHYLVVRRAADYASLSRPAHDELHCANSSVQRPVVDDACRGSRWCAQKVWRTLTRNA